MTLDEAYQRIAVEFAKVDPNHNDRQNGVAIRLLQRGELFDWKLSGQEYLHDEYSSAVRKALGSTAGRQF